MRNSRKLEASIQNPEVRHGERPKGRRSNRAALLFTTGYWLLATGFFFITTGCADDPPASDPTQKAMQDPMHYKPEFERRDAADANGNQQDGLGKDLDHVFNP